MYLFLWLAEKLQFDGTRKKHKKIIHINFWSVGKFDKLLCITPPFSLSPLNGLKTTNGCLVH